MNHLSMITELGRTIIEIETSIPASITIRISIVKDITKMDNTSIFEGILSISIQIFDSTQSSEKTPIETI